VVKVVVDRDGGIDLDAVAEASRLVSEALDAAEAPGDDPAVGGAAAGAPWPGLGGPYVLEVTSPGVDRPLVAPRHWRRARGRLVAVETTDGERFVGRVRAAGADTAVLLPVAAARSRPGSAPAPAREIRYAEVARAVVEIEFGPVPDLDDDDDEAVDAGADFDSADPDGADLDGADFDGADEDTAAARGDGDGDGAEVHR
jgi:ribosome maturation factor RimP